MTITRIDHKTRRRRTERRKQKQSGKHYRCSCTWIANCAIVRNAGRCHRGSGKVLSCIHWVPSCETTIIKATNDTVYPYRYYICTSTPNSTCRRRGAGKCGSRITCDTESATMQKRNVTKRNGNRRINECMNVRTAGRLHAGASMFLFILDFFSALSFRSAWHSSYSSFRQFSLKHVRSKWVEPSNFFWLRGETFHADSLTQQWAPMQWAMILVRTCFFFSIIPSHFISKLTFFSLSLIWLF